LEVEQAHTLPELGSNWARRLEATGFALLGDRSVEIDQLPPHPEGTVRYAQLWLDRLRSGLADRLSPEDAETLAALTDAEGPESVRERDDLRLRGSRTLILARRP
jgi:hypothetical protein